MILLVSGSVRSGSSNTAALATIAAAVAGTELYDGLAALPVFNPDDDHDPLPPTVAALRTRIARADAVVFCTPEYAGTVPGALKNLLEWTVGGTEMAGRPVAWIAVAPQGRGAGAVATLELVLGYVGADLVAPACASVPLARDDVGPDGLVTDPDLVARLIAVPAMLARQAGR